MQFQAREAEKLIRAYDVCPFSLGKPVSELAGFNYAGRGYSTAPLAFRHGERGRDSRLSLGFVGLISRGCFTERGRHLRMG